MKGTTWYDRKDETMDRMDAFDDDHEGKIPFDEDLMKVLGHDGALYPHHFHEGIPESPDDDPVIGEGPLADWLRSLTPEEADRIDGELEALERAMDGFSDGIIAACDTLDAALDDFQDWIDSL